MADKLKFVLLLAIVSIYQSELTAQQISVEDFFAVLSENQYQIDLIRQGVTDAYEYFELDNLEYIASESPDPQAYLDYILARYNRVASRLNNSGAFWAQENVDHIRRYQGNVDLSPEVISEGIAKFSDMRDFFLDYGRQQDAEYHRLWDIHTSRYGEMGKEFFEDDNEFLKLYDVYVRD